jgi:hypothetical protein
MRECIIVQSTKTKNERALHSADKKEIVSFFIQVVKIKRLPL